MGKRGGGGGRVGFEQLIQSSVPKKMTQLGFTLRGIEFSED